MTYNTKQNKTHHHTGNASQNKIEKNLITLRRSYKLLQSDFQSSEHKVNNAILYVLFIHYSVLFVITKSFI